MSKHKQGSVIAVHLLLNAIYEKVVLVHIDLHTGGTTIKVKQCLRAMLKEGGRLQLSDSERRTHMHHFRIAFAIASVEEVQHILLKLLTIPVDVFSCLMRY